FSLTLRKEESDLIHERVMWAAGILGLIPYLNRKPKELSGGQRQRVALGRAIVRDPKVFLLDEPLSNLDAKLRGQMRKELKELHHRLGVTMVYVTHDQIEALTLADRIVVMKDGYIQQIATPSELYSKPANLFVANFIGTPPMNFFDALITADGKVVIQDIEVDISHTPSFKSLKDKGYFGKTVFVGVRPEFIKVSRKIPGSKQEGYQTVIDLFELLGSDALVHFNIGAQSVVSKIDAKDIMHPSEEAYFNFDVMHLYYFDKETEMCIYE
ncbi:MAG: ATP-binding cassette domain-containing protein, partial [Acholeplasmataceae bacterium]|nr:ATP-binding cassette domain-containing protein [Acholeplasmataceae bacterium]